MDNTTDILNAISPYQSSDPNDPQGQVLRAKVARASNPFGFEEGVHYGPANAQGLHPITPAGMAKLSSGAGLGIADNSNVIGAGADSAAMAGGMQQQGASMDSPNIQKGLIGRMFDQAKSTFTAGALDGATGGTYSGAKNYIDNKSQSMTNSLLGRTKPMSSQDYYDNLGGQYSTYS